MNWREESDKLSVAAVGYVFLNNPVDMVWRALRVGRQL